MGVYRVFYAIKDFFKYDLWYGLRNLCTWYIIIWNDRNWDSFYILKVLQFKIRQMHLHIEAHENLVGYEEDVKNMKRCEELLGRLIKDDYIEEAGWDSIEHRVHTQKEITACFIKADRARKKDREELFDTLKDHIERWWD